MIANEKFSKLRQLINQQIDEIKQLAHKSAHGGRLVHGVPGKVFRKCGKPTCKCAQNPDDRHGPYMVIQVFRNGKQKQIAIKKSDEPIWQAAKNYQQQIKYLSELKSKTLALEKLVKEIIVQRTEDWPT